MLTNEYDEQDSGLRFFQGAANGCLIELAMFMIGIGSILMIGSALIVLFYLFLIVTGQVP
jgi:hypothetical protein